MSNSDDFSMSSFLNNNAKIEPSADARDVARAIAQIFTALMDEGFTRGESISMTMQMVLDAAKK